MITIQKTVDIPADRRLTVDLPKTIPSGRVNVRMVFDTPAEPAAPDMAETAPAAGDAVSRLLSHTFPTIEEIKAEAAQKAAKREAAIKATGVDPLQKYCGCLKDVFDEDGVVIQRRMRDEWPE
ncbi:MAG: hypothetical protein LBC67_04935 [Spirochaetales bacterium]|jgi:hypothetical protein|nr:hypothetical protein [Spirochaetales bacterium]